MAEIDVSVLLCTLNREEFLREILECLLEQDTSPGFRYEIVVVDNGSTDGTRAVVKACAERSAVPIRYVHEDRTGISTVRNRSVREARGAWLAFIDDDELTTSTWLATFWRGAEETGAQILGGAVRLAMSDDELRTLGPEVRRSLREYDLTKIGSRLRPCGDEIVPGTGNMFVNRRVFEVVGEFDETMTMGGGDSDLIARARRAGFEPWFVPEAVIFHRIPPERLKPDRIRVDSLQSGAMLAFLRRRFHGVPGLVAEAVARIGQAAILTAPGMAIAWLARDNRLLLDRRIRWWRMTGFVRYALVLILPWLSANEAFVDGLDFRRSRPDAPRRESADDGGARSST